MGQVKGARKSGAELCEGVMVKPEKTENQGHDTPRGLVLVVSAPSGTGKTTICRAFMKSEPRIHFSVSYTTRVPRKGERDGKDYFFVSDDEFRKLIAEGEFVEWAENYGNLYGTSKGAIRDCVDRGNDLLLDVDPRGAKNIKKFHPEGVFVFILPPSLDILKERLQRRGSEKEETVKLRTDRALEEIGEAQWYDYVIFNEDVGESLEILKSVYVAEKHRQKRLKSKINNLITTGGI